MDSILIWIYYNDKPWQPRYTCSVDIPRRRFTWQGPAHGLAATPSVAEESWWSRPTAWLSIVYWVLRRRKLYDFTCREKTALWFYQRTNAGSLSVTVPKSRYPCCVILTALLPGPCYTLTIKIMISRTIILFYYVLPDFLRDLFCKVTLLFTFLIRLKTN